MKWPGGAFWIAVAFAAGIGNYVVKQTVQRLDDDLTNVRKKIVAEQKQIHDLTAEWTYLNQPELLADLNRRYLGLVPIAPKQERVGIDEIAMRPAPAPQPGVTETQIAVAAAAAPLTKMAAAIMPASVSVPAPEPATVAGVPPSAAGKAKPDSLDALFDQVARSR